MESIYTTLWQIYLGQYVEKLPELDWFCRPCDKTFWCVFFQFTVPTTIYLQNVNAKFHKVVSRYSGEVYITVWQIYSEQYIPEFVRIGQVLWEI